MFSRAANTNRRPYGAPPAPPPSSYKALPFTEDRSAAFCTVDDLIGIPPMDIEYEDAQRDNTARASFAARMLVAYTDIKGGGDDGIETGVGDMLADLRHLCDAVNVEFDAALTRGDRHYNAEIRGEF